MIERGGATIWWVSTISILRQDAINRNDLEVVAAASAIGPRLSSEVVTPADCSFFEAPTPGN
jgi:hypothetical protein